MILTSILAAGAINAAAVGQVGENYCHLTWDKQCCPVPGCNVSIAPGVLTICNEKPEPAEFTWVLTDVSGLGLQFMPSSGTSGPGNSPFGVPSTCVDIPFTVICPPNFPVGSVADYQATVTKVGTMETFTCFGNVRNVSDWKLDPVGDPVIDVSIPVDATQPAVSSRGGLSVSNIGSSGKDGVSITPVVMGPFRVEPSQLVIPPITPGSSFTVDSFFDVFYEIQTPQSLTRGAPPQSNIGDILFMIDTDVPPDGIADTVIGSQTVRGVPSVAPCPGDINNDGVVDTADLGILIGAFGTFCF